MRENPLCILMKRKDYIKGKQMYYRMYNCCHSLFLLVGNSLDLAN